MYRVKPHRQKRSGSSVLVWILVLLTCAAMISVFVVITLWMGLEEPIDSKNERTTYSVPDFETDAKVSVTDKRKVLVDTRDTKEGRGDWVKNNSEDDQQLQRTEQKVRYSIPKIVLKENAKKDENIRQTTTTSTTTTSTTTTKSPEILKGDRTTPSTTTTSTTESPFPPISTRNTFTSNYDDTWKAVTNMNPHLSTRNTFKDYSNPFADMRYNPAVEILPPNVQIGESESKIIRSPYDPIGNFANSPVRRIDSNYVRPGSKFQGEHQTIRNPVIPLTESEFGDSAQGTNYYIYPDNVSGNYDGEDPDIAENPAASFIFKKIQELYKWISTDRDISGIHNSTSNGTKLHKEFKEVLVALNSSIIQGDSSTLLKKLKQLYYQSDNQSRLNITHPYVLNNTNSLVSFGMLSFDVLLLHNVQLMAWEDEKAAKRKMLQDPEIFALNSLFMSPERVRRIQNSPMAKNDIAEENKNVNKTLLAEIFDFVNSALRAILNLSKVYKRSAEPRLKGTVTPMDCVWTLYCRNLEKTARLRGPYGFISRINSFGLRLVMGEFQIEEALEILIEEFTNGWAAIDCERLFPRCSIEDATAVVMDSILDVPSSITENSSHV